MFARARAGCRIGLLAAIALAPVAAQQGVVPAKVGEKVPDFEFPPFQNGDGRQSLSEFAGQPVLIVFWSAALRSPIPLDPLEEFIDQDSRLRDQGLVTLFVEASKADTNDVQPLLWRKRPGFDARVTVADLQMPLPEIREPSFLLI